MEIFYCDLCGRRIGDTDLHEGRAVDVGGQKYCPECIRTKPDVRAAVEAQAAAAATPPGRRSKRSSSRSRRVPHAEKGTRPGTARRPAAGPAGTAAAPARASRSPVLFVVTFGTAFLAAMAVALVAFRRPGDGPGRRPSASATRRRAGGRRAAKGDGPPQTAPVESTAASSPLTAAQPPSAAGKGPGVPAAAETPAIVPAATRTETPAETPVREKAPPEPAARGDAAAGGGAGPSLGEDFFARLRRESDERQAKQKLRRAKLRELGKVATGSGRSKPYEQDAGPDGLVRIEAEEFSAKNKVDTHDWKFVEKPNGYTGRGAMQALPDTHTQVGSDIAARCPRLDYKINFVKTGTHYLWVHMYGVNHNGDSCHGGLDGEVIPSLRKITTNNPGKYYWEGRREGERATFEVPAAGVHTVNIWMREDGTVIDAIVVTSNADYSP